MDEINAGTYVAKESHWLADWGQDQPRCKEGDTVRFKVQKVYNLADWNHVSDARNVKFTHFVILNSEDQGSFIGHHT